MKVLLSAYACDPTRGSEPGCGWSWVYHTARLGHEVWCITRISNRKNVEAWLEKSPITNLHMVYVAAPWWMEYLRLTYHYPAVYLHYLVWQYRTYRTARQIHRAEQLDVTHHVSYSSLQLGSHLWKLDVPFIFGPVGGAQSVPVQFRHYLVKGEFREKLRTLASGLLLYGFSNTRNTIRHAYLVLAANQETYDLVQQLGAQRVKLELDNGIADDFFPPRFPVRPEKERLNVLWIGRLVADKGLSLVIDALQRIEAQYAIHLTIVGDGPLEQHYHTRMAELELTDRVTFLGRIPFHQLKSWYRSSDVLLYTGLRNTFGIQLLEAMSFGLPVVTLNLHGVRTFVPDNVGIKVDPDDGERTAQAIKQALMRLYVDPEHRTTLGQNAYRYAKQHIWSAKVAHVNQAYPAESGSPSLSGRVTKGGR